MGSINLSRKMTQIGDIRFWAIQLVALGDGGQRQPFKESLMCVCVYKIMKI